MSLTDCTACGETHHPLVRCFPPPVDETAGLVERLRTAAKRANYYLTGEAPLLDRAADVIGGIDPCPEWNCPDLSQEDRREGKTCRDHPCSCKPKPDAERAVRELRESGVGAFMILAAVTKVYDMEMKHDG